MINIKTRKDIEWMKEGGELLIRILAELKEYSKPGITTLKLENLALHLIQRWKAKPSFKGHNGYPAALCISVNDELVHGLPSKKILQEGDIVSLDLGIFYKGFHTDAAITFALGKTDQKTNKLIRTTYEALKYGLKFASSEYFLSDISSAIQKKIESAGFSVIRDCTGHGIGKQLHEDPPVPNFVTPGKKLPLKRGMILCIEPMAAIGSSEIYTKDDGWTIATKDGKNSAHFEETIAIEDTKPLRLTNLDSIVKF